MRIGILASQVLRRRFELRAMDNDHVVLFFSVCSNIFGHVRYSDVLVVLRLDAVFIRNILNGLVTDLIPAVVGDDT